MLVPCAEPFLVTLSLQTPRSKISEKTKAGGEGVGMKCPLPYSCCPAESLGLSGGTK